MGSIARAALFDVDGTLVDTNDLHVAAWHQAFLHFGHDIGPERIRPQVGKGGDNLLPTLLPQLDEAARQELEAFVRYSKRWLGRACVSCWLPPRTKRK